MFSSMNHWILCRRCFNLRPIRRSLFSQTGEWEKTFTAYTRIELENHWKERLKDVKHTYKEGQKKYYVLSMFPYPSGQLHMGHVRVYTISDAMARYHRLNNKNVIHPMGWDAFGLPAENAAIERGERPAVWTHSNIKSMKKQMEQLCYSFDWESEFATCDPEYYKWTQHLFLQMYHAGLIYQKEGAVNWDPVDQTVLADEQIDDEGRSWRSGAVAVKRFIRQWYIKTTAYSKSLIDGLAEVDSTLWKDVLELQRQWIGSCDGVRLEFKVKMGGAGLGDPLSVFTKHPHLVYGASHILISPQHYLNSPHSIKDTIVNSVEETQGYKEMKTVAVNPFNGRILPMFICEDWQLPETLDSHLGIPDALEDDRVFAQQWALPYESVLDTQTDTVVNSGKISGLSHKEAFESVAAIAKDMGCGGNVTSEIARDWLISRQRYWGTPIPIVHCPKYGPVPVAYEDLPVTLPDVMTLTGKGESPLVTADDWRKVKCSRCDCDSHGLRETDTMDTFVDSSWYFLRYLDDKNRDEPVSAESAARGMPVDLYIGGKEHARMHLYYARFFNHFLCDRGVVPQREPFVNLLTQGMVMGQSYQDPETGRYLTRAEVDLSGSTPVHGQSGAPLVATWEKMSKSKHNGVDPQDVLDEFGCDATRLSILSNVAPKSDRNWSNDVFVGVQRWQSRIWSLVTQIREHRGQHQSDNTMSVDQHETESHQDEVRETRNYFVNQVSQHMEKTFLLSVAISRLQGLTNALKKVPGPILATSPECERAVADLLIMMSPFAPLFASELWEGLRKSSPHTPTGHNWDKDVWSQTWPVIDDDFRLFMKVMVDGKERFKVPLMMTLAETELLEKDQAVLLAKDEPQFGEHLKDADIVSCSLLVDLGLRMELNFITKNKKKKKSKKR